MTQGKSPGPLDIALGAAIRISRLALGLSQGALANLCGVSFQQIQKYESGANRISFSRLVQISKALSCRVVDLIGVLEDADENSQDDLLSRLTTPGILELLETVENLSEDQRHQLIGFIKNLPVTGPAK